MDATAAESGSASVWRMIGLARDGTAEPVSLTRFSAANGDKKILIFPFLTGHEQDWQPYPVDPHSAESLDHTRCSYFRP